ncbi:MAG TPA: hypothetical protein VFV89_18470 [Nocardioides sp.]|uniref:hypothetical protein n=1 Tax=Nocardioides sp. TaxID=35761 RepID=UPI002E345937|nr:hypothetical protein [Nocardioides sp.]HEX5089798.1 hypothetical protein [Nocardioides sp.]
MGLPCFRLPRPIGLALALQLATLALCRSGIVRWWAVVPVVVATFIGYAVTSPGCLAFTACFTVFSVALARGTGEPRLAGERRQAGRSSASTMR